MKTKDGTKKLYLISNYFTQLYELNSDGLCIKGDSLITIEDAIELFKTNQSVKTFGIIHTYVEEFQDLTNCENLPEVYFGDNTNKWRWNIIKKYI